MTGLRVRFIRHQEISPELRIEIEELDHLAFAGDGIDNDPEFANIRWATPDWMALGFLHEELVTQLCMPKREIMVGVEKIWVAGIGGMATHPKHHHKGYGSALLAATEPFIRDEIQVPFGLLICANTTRPFYERARWQHAANMLYYRQDDQRRELHTSVMTLQLQNQTWPAGKIDLCGAPW
ncbi:MAG: GNAT family N-acetyltransferase [Anaerolineales bacterium]|nr:GNAT family N-acetyltransferase [Anaerolineales bacterium]